MRTAIQSFELGAWLPPVLDGELRIEKPPLLYWLMMVSFSAFGVEFWTARLPSLLFGLGFAFFVATLYSDLFKRDRLLPFLIALSLLTIAVESRRAMLDLPVAVCTVVALTTLLRQQRSPRSYWWVAAALAATAGFYFKGPVALWFIATGVVAFRVATRGSVRPAMLGATAILALVLIGLWPLLLTLSSPDWLDRLVVDSADREFGWPSLKNLRAVLAGLVVASLPWLLVVVRARPGTANDAKDRATMRALWLWIALAVVPFLFLRTFERYLLPLAAPIVLLISHVLNCNEPSRRLHLMSSVVMTALPIVLLSALICWLAPSKFVFVAASVAIAVLVIAGFFAWRQAITVTIVLLISATTMTLGHLYPQLGVNRLPAEVIADFAAGSGAHYASPYPGTLSMVLGRSVPVIERDDQSALQDLARKEGLLVLRTDDLHTLRIAAQRSNCMVKIERRFAMWYSRGSFLRLGKPGLARDTLGDAIKRRDLKVLQPEFVTVRISTGHSQ
jgi:4-amino-4-deoxy-L-arabinose transferase-like glycosyltransferase